MFYPFFYPIYEIVYKLSKLSCYYYADWLVLLFFIQILQSVFNKSLSQKIRHIRLSLKTKSQRSSSDSTAEPPAKKQCFKVVAPVCSTALTSSVTSSDDITRHTNELLKEWEKSSPNVQHLKALLTATRGSRIAMLEKTKDDCMKNMFETYPCFGESKYVSLYLSTAFQMRFFSLSECIICFAQCSYRMFEVENRM